MFYLWQGDWQQVGGLYWSLASRIHRRVRRNHVKHISWDNEKNLVEIIGGLIIRILLFLAAYLWKSWWLNFFTSEKWLLLYKTMITALTLRIMHQQRSQYVLLYNGDWSKFALKLWLLSTNSEKCYEQDVFKYSWN